MTILPEPAHFKKSEYAKLLQEYPHVKNALAAPFINEDGEAIPLVKETEREVLVYIGLISKAQEEQLGWAALREIRKQLRKSGKTRKPLVFLGICLTSLIMIVVFITAGKDIIRIIFPTPTPTLTVKPSPSPTPTPTVKPSPSPTPTPTVKPSPTPTVKPTPTPTVKPIPTSTPTPIPSPTVTPTPTIPPTATPIPTSGPLSIRKVTLRDENGLIVSLIEGKYSVKAREKIRLEIDVENPSNHKISMTYNAIKGKVEANGVYIAPDNPGEKDIVTIRAEDRDAGKIIQKPLNINIIE